MIADKTLLFTRCATSNASRHFKSPLAMGRDAFKSKHTSSVSISEVIDTGVNSNHLLQYVFYLTFISYRSIHTLLFQDRSSLHVPDKSCTLNSVLYSQNDHDDRRNSLLPYDLQADCAATVSR